MKRQDVFPATYLKKEDVSRPFITTIGRVVMEELKGDNGMEHKPVMHWMNDTQKPMVLNNTNWTTLEEAYGDDSDYWQGKPVEVYVDPSIMMAGKRVGGVRLRIPTAPASNGNGHAPSDVWTWEQAQVEALKVGVTKEDIVAKLKSLGFASWTSIRDTPTVRGMILEKQAFTPGPSLIQGEESIPFSWLIGMVTAGLSLVSLLV